MAPEHGDDARSGTDTARARPVDITIAGRRLTPSPVFDTYWRFAANRHEIYLSRLKGEEEPWTDDPILKSHRFTNAYRVADRVSQYLVRHVAYEGDDSAEEVAFRILLFKLFNKVETWELLQTEFGIPSWADFDVEAYDSLLGRAFSAGRRLYSAAYVMPPPRFGARRKHTNHLRLLQAMMDADLPRTLQGATKMQEAFRALRDWPGMGDFLAYQLLIDLNYSTLLSFDESDFVVPGPGARDGIRKCFGPAANGIEADVITYMTETQEKHFTRLGLRFDGLWGRPLQLVDCQNLFCEVDKYARVAHPDVAGISGRTRIKQRFNPSSSRVTAWFPPKWGLNDRVRAEVATDSFGPSQSGDQEQDLVSAVCSQAGDESGLRSVRAAAITCNR